MTWDCTEGDPDTCAQRHIDLIYAKKRIEELERGNLALQHRWQAYETLAKIRGKRMQIMKSALCDINAWQTFLVGHPEAANWFDEDGVPIREGK